MNTTTSSNPCIRLFLLVSFLLLTSIAVVAQNEVSIGSATTKSNAILWLNGNGSQGLVLPVVTNKSAVSNPDKGMVVYDDSDNKVWYRSSSAWVEVGSGTGSSTANLNLLLQGNQLQLRDGTTVQSTVNIAGGTQSNGAFLVFTGGSWQYATLSGDVIGANGALVVNGIKGKTVATLPATLQALVYDPSANSSSGGWVFQALTSGGTVTNIIGTSPVTVTNPTTTPTISIATGGITNTLVATDAVNSSKIQDATITGADIAGSTITADKLAQSAATTGQVLKWNGTNWVPQNDDAGTGTTPTLSNGQILVGNGTTNSAIALNGDATLSGGLVTIGNNAITSAKILDAAITGADIANSTIAATKLAQSGANNNQVLQWNGTNWVPVTLSSGGTVTQINTANGLTGGPITNSGSISIASSGVGATELADNAVVTNKISDNAVTTSKINNSAVDNTKLADNAVTSVKISDGSITNADIANTTITATKLAQSSATSGQVLKWNGTNWIPAADDAGTGTTPTLSNGQILAGNGTTNSAVALSGDATLSGGVITIGNNAITTTEITDASITGADLAANIAISTTGNVNVNAPGIISGIGSGLTTLNATNISSGSLALARITAGTNGQVLTTTAGVPAWQTPVTGTTTLDGLTDATVTAASSGQLLINDGAGQFRNVGMSGDATISSTGVLTLNNGASTRNNLGLGSLATLSTVDLAGGNITGILPVANGGTGRSTWDGLLLGSPGNITDISTGTPGQFLRVVGTSPSWQTFAVTSTDITDGTITNTDINGSAAIAGTKVSPIFGTQNISTTGTLSAGATTVSGLTIGTSLWPANASGALTNDGTGSLSWATSSGSGWSLTGNTLIGTERIGSDNAQPLAFETANTERMRIDASGDVGIGTTNPRSKLEIQAGDLILSGSTAVPLDPPDINFVLLDGTIKSKIWTSQTTNTLWISTDIDPVNNKHLTLDPNGNVGIGATAPNYLLHVNDGSNTQGALQITAGTATGSSSSDGLILTSNSSAANILNRENTSLNLGTSGLTRITITGAGNIGLGNTAPNAQVQLATNTANRKLVLYDVNNNDHGFYGFGVESGAIRYQTQSTLSNHRFYAGTSSTTSALLMTISGGGNVAITGSLSKGSGTFKIDHPLDPENKYLYHSFVESPDMMNVYNGNIITNEQGEVAVTLPDYFEALNRDFRYQLTVIGTFAQAIVYKKIENNKFVIKTDKPNVEVSWQVTGIRKDPFAEKNRVIPEVEKDASEKGRYLHPEAYGKSSELKIGIQKNDTTKINH